MLRKLDGALVVVTQSFKNLICETTKDLNEESTNLTENIGTRILFGQATPQDLLQEVCHNQLQEHHMTTLFNPTNYNNDFREFVVCDWRGAWGARLYQTAHSYWLSTSMKSERHEVEAFQKECHERWNLNPHEAVKLFSQLRGKPC